METVHLFTGRPQGLTLGEPLWTVQGFLKHNLRVSDQPETRAVNVIGNRKRKGGKGRRELFTIMNLFMFLSAKIVCVYMEFCYFFCNVLHFIIVFLRNKIYFVKEMARPWKITILFVCTDVKLWCPLHFPTGEFLCRDEGRIETLNLSVWSKGGSWVLNTTSNCFGKEPWRE